MGHSRSIAREIGTAFAVLALYLLTILTPLHQARATQLDFAALGYQTLETGWVLCTAETDRNETRGLITKCPAAGIGKQQLAEPTLAVLTLDSPPMAVPVLYVALAQPPTVLHRNPAISPRGPPALA